jgi:Outer membrane protein beta-barrel domain
MLHKLKSYHAACVVFVVMALLASVAFAGGPRIVCGAQVGAYNPYIRHGDVDEFDAFTRAAVSVGAGLTLSDRAMLNFSFLTAAGKANIDNHRNIKFDVDEALLDLHWLILTGMIRPQFLVGGSYQMIHVDRVVEDEGAFGFNFGLGLDATLIGDLSASFIARYHYIYVKKFASSNATSALLGLNYRF